MKKRLFFITLIYSFLVVLNSPATSAHADINYNITGYTINSVLYANGGMDITESLNYHFDDSANGVFRDIDYLNSVDTLHSGSGISNLKIYETTPGVKAVYEYRKGNARNGDEGVYTLSEKKNGLRIKIYSPVRSEHNKSFMLKYHISNTIVKYRDTADFYWKFIGSGWECNLHNVNILVTIPRSSDNLRFFSHGPLSGENSFIDKQTVKYHISRLEAGDSVSLRLLFPTDILSSIEGSKIVNSEILKNALLEEKKKADKANLRRSNLNTSIGLAVIWPILGIIFYIFLYKKYGTRPRRGVGVITSPPDAYGPAFTEYATSYGAIGPKGITAELMNLVRKKYIIFEEEPFTKDTNPKKTDYRLTLAKGSIKCDYLHEEFLIQWFFKIIGDGTSVTYNEIKAYSQKNRTSFGKDFSAYKKLLKQETDELNLKREKTAALKSGIFFSIFSILSGTLLGIIYLMYEFMFSSIIVALIILLLSPIIKKPTEELALFKENWASYKKYILSLTNNKIPNKRDQDLTYWEQALLYMIIFGNYTDGIKRVQTDYPVDCFSDINLTYLHHTGGGYNGIDAFSSSVTSSISNFSSTSGISSGGSSGSSSAGGGGGGGGGGAF